MPDASKGGGSLQLGSELLFPCRLANDEDIICQRYWEADWPAFVGRTLRRPDSVDHEAWRDGGDGNSFQPTMTVRTSGGHKAQLLAGLMAVISTSNQKPLTQRFSAWLPTRVSRSRSAGKFWSSVCLSGARRREEAPGGAKNARRRETASAASQRNGINSFRSGPGGPNGPRGNGSHGGSTGTSRPFAAPKAFCGGVSAVAWRWESIHTSFRTRIRAAWRACP